ncbi:zf-DHHC-domain-containing protein [Fomitiporia mediterranea MF3/22]|uniref:zf-DHHC-domain-containing protein n=1 Tax=Fomitiporia mediterranea (strain MF3/22) TaxID=694068 RepID=UPI0004407380|nr:zf-DHHC-domain-containing protein [Fomitiporia mediterranea MF3/22]EJD04892.1 zf-DHHC-domain-containing protein [Fomitiporia mediterranea MF3/22]
MSHHDAEHPAVTNEPKSKEATKPEGPETSNETKGENKKMKRKRKFIGFSERREMKRRERESKPRPWIERKIVVPFVIGIAGYAWYVYIGRFCVPMIRRERNAFGGRSMGVVFIIVFCLLGLMFWWSYMKLLFTPPGFARDFVQKTPPPQRSDQFAPGRRTTPSAHRSWGNGSDYEGSDYDEDGFIGGTPYAEISPSSTNEGPSRQHQPVDVEKQAELNVRTAPHRPPAPVSQASSSVRRKDSASRTPLVVSDSKGRYEVRRSSGGERSTDETAVEKPKLGGSQRRGSDAPQHPLAKQADPTGTSNPRTSQPPRAGGSTEDGLPPPMYSRRPPTYPSLLPEYQYCHKDGLVKPMRTHHCRICGTCVLMYDHHCPWVGQCVGAHNHKFFVNFLTWSTPWTLWIFATLVGLQAKRDSRSGADIDPQIVVIIALSALFSLFTSVLLGAHIHMIMLNQTSVEGLMMSNMRHREHAILGQMVPLCDWRRSNVHKRRKALRKEWDTEWGKLDTEGNIWWLESAGENWRYRMGRNVWGWFLPIGKSEGDGLTYPRNPRFDEDGRWRRRRDWPPELQ